MVNSFASSVTARNTVVVHRRLSRDHDVEIVETNRRGHATRFAHDAARRGVDVVVGFGGDGTLNEVATGIAGTDTALGVLPGGSTNVFARTIGLPNDPVAAVELLADGIDAGDLRPIGLGQVNGRFFCFHTGVGYDAAVVATVERRASLKRWLGHPLFITAGADDVGPRLRPRAPALPGRRPTTRASTTASSRSCSTPTRTRTSATARSTCRTPPRSTAAWSSSRSARCARRTILALARRRAARRRGRADDHLDEQIDLDHLVIEHDDAVPLPARRRLPRRDRPPRVPPRPRRRPPRLPRDRSSDVSVSAASADDRASDADRSAVSGRTRVEGGAASTSGTSVTMPSTPAIGEGRRRGRVVARPGVDAQAGVVAALDLLGGDRRLPRVHRGVAARRRDVDGRRRRARIVSHAVGTVGSSSRQRSTVASRNDEISQRPAAALGERRPAPRRRRGRRGSKSGSRSSFLISMLTHSAGAGVERLAERRHVRRQLPPRRVDDDPSVTEHGVVVDDEHAVGGAPHIQLDAVGAERSTASSNASTVFSGASRDAPRWAMTSVTGRTVPLVTARSVP